jgi:amidase
MSNPEVCFMTARNLVQAIRTKELSAREVMAAHLEQIKRYNPQVNAIVTLLPERAMEAADEADRALARGEPLGPLHGLPIAHKDLVLTKGIRTTFGSPIFASFVPEEDDLIVERLRSAGALAIGKTNTPEFGAGSQTYNEVFGLTRNPYDLSKTCGGSSGGAAVALACGMIPIADGSDTGGSLRNPANYCNVVGFRPSPGRVPAWPKQAAWATLSVQGPMARTVGDVALLLSAMAGPDPRSPISITEPGDRFRRPLGRDFQGVRIAWSPDFGELPVDPFVTASLEDRLGAFSELGCQVERAQPDFAGADEAFKALRAWQFELSFGALLDNHPGKIKDTIVWNVEEGKRLTGPQLGRAEHKRTELYQRVRRFMEEYEFMLFPVSQVPPFDITQLYVTEINGVEMATYIDWMKSCYYISVLALPAISVPCSFTEEGLPVGLQIVGRLHDDWGVLQLAHAFEQVTQAWQTRPPMVGTGGIR